VPVANGRETESLVQTPSISDNAGWLDLIQIHAVEQAITE